MTPHDDITTRRNQAHVTTPLHFLWRSSNDPGPVSVDSVPTADALSGVCGTCSGIGGGSTVVDELVDACLPPAAVTTGIRRRGRAEWPPPIKAIRSVTSTWSLCNSSRASGGKTVWWANNGSYHNHIHSLCPWPPYTMASHVRSRPVISPLTRKRFRFQRTERNV